MLVTSRRQLGFQAADTKGNALEIDVDQGVFDGVILFVGDDDRRALDTGDLDVENRVVSGLAADDSQDVFRVNADGLGVFESSIDDSGDHSCNARTAHRD